MPITPYEVHVMDQLEASYHGTLLPTPPQRSSWFSRLSHAVGWTLERIVCPDFTLITPVFAWAFPATTRLDRQRIPQHNPGSDTLRHGSNWGES
jgi:hypothetical protein